MTSTYEFALRESAMEFKRKQIAIMNRKNKLRHSIPKDTVRYSLSCIMIDEGYDIDQVDEVVRKEMVNEFWMRHGVM